jgi:hypothetical protein
MDEESSSDKADEESSSDETDEESKGGKPEHGAKVSSENSNEVPPFLCNMEESFKKMISK